MPKIVRFSEKFKKHFKARIKPNAVLRKKTLETLQLFEENRESMENDHQLEGKMSMYRAFNVTDDIRVIYLETETKIIFDDIGTHKQVYKR